MLARIVDARHAGAYRVWLRFDDGLTGEVNLEQELWGPLFGPLRDPAEFAKLRCGADTDTVVWPNGADFSPSWLRQRLVEAQRNQVAAE